MLQEFLSLVASLVARSLDLVNVKSMDFEMRVVIVILKHPFSNGSEGCA